MFLAGTADPTPCFLGLPAGAAEDMSRSDDPQARTIKPIFVLPVAVAVRYEPSHFAKTEKLPLHAGGLRGALSMVLVHGLPVGFPHRELLINMTFGVVVVSILVQGLSMAPLLKRLGLVSGHAQRSV